MYVYVRFEGSVKVVSNVTIDEDCGPVVEGKLISDSPRSDGGGENANVNAVNSRSNVDAISWFKSLPMEAVYLDCSARDARWSARSVTILQSESDPNAHLLTPKVSVRLRKNPTKRVHIDEAVMRVEENRPFMPETARALFSDHPGVVDFNPIIDEMFERAEGLVRNWDRLSNSGELYNEVAQILHCYVFPHVTFQKEDIAILQECLRLVTLRQEGVEKDIKDTEKSIDVTERYLNRQKEVILDMEGMTTQSYLQACDVQFVEALYTHVTKDIQKKNARLDNTQLKMNDLKKKQATTPAGEDPEKLQRLKKERDGLHESVQKLIVFREAIRNHLYRPFIPKKKKRRAHKVKLSQKDAGLHSVFVNVHQQLVEHKDQLRKLCYRKLYTSSVREAVESTVKMLGSGNPRGLGDFSEFSIYVGNDEVKQQQWRSMQAKVEQWMGGSDLALCHAHLEGCQLVKDLSCGIIGDSQVSSLGLEAFSFNRSIQESSGGQDGGGLGIEDLEMSIMSQDGEVSGGGVGASSSSARDVRMSAEENDLSYRRAPMVKVVRDQVKVHTWDMAEKIVNRMAFQTSPGTRHINRAWVCYDPYFWQEAGTAVEQIYTHFHAPQARRVHRLIRSVPVSDIMDSNFFRDFFHQRLSQMSGNSFGGGGGGEEGEEESAVPFKAADAMSAVSLDLMRCSVSDLYARVNRDGARLNYEMLEMEESLCGSMDMFSVQSGSADSLVVVDVLQTEEENSDPKSELGRSSNSSTSDSGASVHSEDLFDLDQDHHQHQRQQQQQQQQQQRGSRPDTVRTSSSSSSQTVASVMSLFEQVVGPYHQLVQEVMEASGVMEKMGAVWRSVDFLCRKAGEVCKARGMDTLLPLSIFATSSFPEPLFVEYYVQLLILTDLKPSFAFHSMYDFALTNAISSYVYLFQAKFPPATTSAAASSTSDESDQSS